MSLLFDGHYEHAAGERSTMPRNKRRSDAKKVEKNALKKHGIRCRFFFCEIGRIIEETSYRVKTDKVRLNEEISV